MKFQTIPVGMQLQSAPRRGQTAVRCGSVYVAVLGVSMILGIIGLTALHTSRAEVAELAAVEQTARAELLAQSAIEYALCVIEADSAWRTSYTNGQELPSNSWISLGGSGGFRAAASDVDGNLADNQGDGVTLRGIGQSGKSTSVVIVDAEPSQGPLTCLDSSLHAGGSIGFQSAASTSNQTVSSNNSISITPLLASYSGDAWTTGLIVGLVGGSSQILQTPPRQMPDTTAAFAYYLANGTKIDMSSIPLNRIANVVLSAGNNPYGAENPQGIYIIDCQGQQLTIQDSRIEATLVVLSPSNTVDVNNRIHWEPPASNFPALMVQGSVEMRWDGNWQLTEGGAGVNFNPPSTPYLGISDLDTTDVYPGLIKGLVYTTGNLSVTRDCTVKGCIVVAGSVTVTDRLMLTYDSVHRDYPPPGFSSGNKLRIVPGTWRRTTR